MTRWRKRIGADELELLLAESLVVAVKTKAVTQRQLERVTVDTTVQTKAVAHPTDSHLILRAIQWLNRAAKRHGIKLRQSFLRLATKARREVARLLHTGGHKQGLRWLRFMRTWLGRLTRDIRRKIAGDPALEAAFATVLERAERILAQQPRDKNKLYALHAPEVECIGKGKARTRYEFGCKTSIATTNERCKGGQFVLGAMSLPGSPYDDHSLAGQIDQVTRLTGTTVKRAYVDRGYRGHKVERDGLDITISHTRGITSPTIRREMRRRSDPLGECTHSPAGNDRTRHRTSQGRWASGTKPPRRTRWPLTVIVYNHLSGNGCEQRNPLRRRSQHASPGSLDQASFCSSGGNHPRPNSAEPRRSPARYCRIIFKTAKITGDQVASMPRSCSRSSTLRSDSGKRTYIMTARRMIYGEVLK
jgi:IS5 family transposase